MTRIRVAGHMNYDHTLLYNELKLEEKSIELRDKTDSSLLRMLNKIKDLKSNQRFLHYSFICLITTEEYTEMLEVTDLELFKYNVNKVLISGSLLKWRVCISDMLSNKNLNALGKEFFTFFYKEHPTLWKEVSNTNGLIRVSS